MSRYAVSFQVCPWRSGNRETGNACTVRDTGEWGSLSKASWRLTSSPETVDVISSVLQTAKDSDRQTDKAFAGFPSEVDSPLRTERVDNTSYFMNLHFPQGRHLPYGYEISFADSIRLDANVHKVFFALERSRIWTLRHGNWANAAVTHRSLYLKCKHDKQSVDRFLCLLPQLFSPN